jgi:23S rRNA (uracil1939-C5)-methyltransferase
MKHPSHKVRAVPRGVRREPQETLHVTIEKPIYGGAFLARVEGKAIFAPLTLPGEQALVRTTDTHRGYANAELIEITSPAPARVVPPCPHFGSCGGCDYQHADYAAQLAFKEAVLRETLERGGVQPPAGIDVLAAEPWGYRNRIRLALDANGNAGYRGRRSHAVTPIVECPIAAPLLVKAGLAAARIFRSLESAQRPAEISLFCDAREEALLVSIVTANPAKRQAEDYSRALAEQVPALKGVEFVSEGLAGRQAHTSAHWGERSLLYHAAGFDYRVDQGAFFQVNRWLVDRLVERVAADHAGRLAWDLFAGVGLFARRLTSSFEKVIAVESAPAAIQPLRENLSRTSGEAVRADTLDFLRQFPGTDRPDLIVVDPPRMGLGAEINSILTKIAAPRLIYVSCDPATLARDLRELIAGGYTIESFALADLFPQTFHIESVVYLRRT